MENLEAYELLALAVKVAISDKDISLATGLIHRAKALAFENDVHNFEWLAMAASQQVCDVLSASCRTKTPSTHTEYGLVQSWFKHNHKSIFPGSSLEKVKAGRYVPDFMLRLEDGSVIPVECKKVFGERSRIQLQDYIEHFNAPFGVAVATKLSVSLPESMKFVLRPKE